MEAASAPTGSIALPGARSGSTRLLELVSDEGLVKRVRAGNERAFDVIYERYQRPMLAFSRHMLGSQQEAEDAVQQTFANAFRDLLGSDRDIKLRPWLYQIARNQCITMLRRRRPTDELPDSQPSLVGLSDEVAGRGELRALLADLALLPFPQREALVLAELHDNSHADVAAILGCEAEKVKSLVFQARSSLIASREARDLSCDDVRTALSVLRGPALRRGTVGRHVKQCSGCRSFVADVRRQRQQLATLLVVTPSAGLKFGAANAIAASGVQAAIGGTASGGAAATGTAAGTATGLTAGGAGMAGTGAVATGTAAAGKLLLPAALVKGVAAVTAASVLAAGGAVGVQRVRDAVAPQSPGAAATATAHEGKAPGDSGRLRSGGPFSGALPPVAGTLPGHGQRNGLDDGRRGKLRDEAQRRLRRHEPRARLPGLRPPKPVPPSDRQPGTTEPRKPAADQPAAPDSPPTTP